MPLATTNRDNSQVSHHPARTIYLTLVSESSEYLGELERVLQAHNYRPVIRHVQSEAELLAGIEEKACHIIVAEWAHSVCLARQAFRKVVSLHPGLKPPLFLALFPDLDEQTIVDAIRMGADGFLLASNLAAIVPAIEKHFTTAHNPIRKMLKNSEQLLSALLEESTDSIWAKDRDGRYLLINPAGAEFLGKTIDEVIGKTDDELFDPPTAQKIVASDQQVIANGSTETIEGLLITRAGIDRTFQAVKSVFRDENGEIQGVIGTVRDISERCKTEEQLQYYATQLERSNNELEHFALIASHDLQAPLRKIHSFAHLLQRHVDAEGQDLAMRLQASSEKMQQFIANLLALSQVSSKGNSFQHVKLETIIDSVLDDLWMVIQENNVAIKVDNPGSVYGDSFQMEQLFANLINNSIKYRKSDTPCEIKIRGELLENGFRQVTIQDNGIGIKKQYLDRIFRPFERLHGESKYAGTGMGLAICHKIIQRHGGQILASSQEGEGSTFVLYLPTQQPVCLSQGKLAVKEQEASY